MLVLSDGINHRSEKKMKTISILFAIVLFTACSHTTHVSPSPDGKTAWIAHDSIFLFFIESEKFFCVGDPEKPKCMRTIDKEQEQDARPKSKNIIF